MDGREWYYDNDDELPPGTGDEAPSGPVAEQWMSVDRVYCLDWRRFLDVHWDGLDRIYRTLPGWRSDAPDVARWFTGEGSGGPYLWASVEPPGLQVAGGLATVTWWDWDLRFRRAVDAAGLPRSAPE
ncbi:hypothetical protein [Streptomyces avicenniae]|uniref:hypothetical protein n=1 Tax=Streptomyces avicenniae TaxID=500153 RepID=UPI00069BDF53|nr:hypothetical protein [Streptomyces avicenniae]